MMRPRAASRLFVVPLEDRTAPTAADLSAGEQYLLELVNRARANPAAEAARYGVDLNEGLPAGTLSGAPAQPLAPEDRLQAAAAGRLGYLAGIARLSHAGPDGGTPG